MSNELISQEAVTPSYRTYCDRCDRLIGIDCTSEEEGVFTIDSRPNDIFCKWCYNNLIEEDTDA